MGYMGLKHLQESDTASAMLDTSADAMCRVMRAELKVKENEFNTDGVINVAMFFRDYITPYKQWRQLEHPGLQKLAKRTLKRLKKKIKKEDKPELWEDQANRRQHIGAYKRMAARLEAYLAEEE